MTILRRVAWVALFVAFVYAGLRFVQENASGVDVDFVLGQVANVALWKVLLIAAGGGVLVTALFLGVALLRARLESRRYRKAMLNLESEVHQLRNLPVMGHEPAPQSESVSTAAATPEGLPSR